VEEGERRPVDHTGLSYDKLRGPTGIPWSVNAQAPDGTERLYADLVFPTDTDVCETYGHDLLTGAAVTQQEHRAMAPAGRRDPLATLEERAPTEPAGCSARSLGRDEPPGR
jgi:hypothetical protein